MAKLEAGQAVTRYLRSHVFAPRYRREERLSLTAADGVRLHAWRIAGPPDAPCSVVLVHGFSNWSRTPSIHAFAQLLSRRVHVVVPDLRGHGRSEGHCSLGKHEPLDVAAAVAATPAELPTVTVGVSLGGAAVLLHAGTVGAGSVAGVVAVSAPSSREAMDRNGSHRVERLVRARAGRMLLAQLLRTRVGLDCDGLPDSAAAMAAIAPAFTIVVHDPDDWYFGPQHAERLFAWAKEPKELWWYPGGGHGTDLLTPEFAERLLSQLVRRVGPSSTR
ncbi:MAG TPA: alpha/beta fold hydrolase [Acidimicrobiales bacterium]|nr:alpha/beta fold hydrolase [Acidimicrobiales bacterium]